MTNGSRVGGTSEESLTMSTSTGRDEADSRLTNGPIQVEANVHDSSNETHDTSLEDVTEVEEAEEGGNNTETLPLSGRRRRRAKAPLAATESDV
jgi:hypothetical protein